MSFNQYYFAAAKYYFSIITTENTKGTLKLISLKFIYNKNFCNITLKYSHKAKLYIFLLPQLDGWGHYFLTINFIIKCFIIPKVGF